MRWSRVALLPVLCGAIGFAACSAFTSSEDTTASASDAALESSSADALVADGGSLEGATPPPPMRCAASPGTGPAVAGAFACDGGTFDLADNAEHCGECAYACPSGRSCAEGTCAVEQILSTTGFPRLGRLSEGSLDIATGDNATGGVAVEHLDFDAGAALPTLMAKLPSIALVVADDQATYLQDYNGISTAVGPGGIRYSVGSTDMHGGVATARNGRLYYVDSQDKVAALLPDGGHSLFHVDVPAAALTIDDATLFWMSLPDDAGVSTVGRVDRVTSAITTAPTNELASNALAVDDQFIYFYAGAQKQFRRIAKDFTSPSELIATWTGDEAGSAAILTVDGDYLYAILRESFFNAVVRVAKCGGPPRRLVASSVQVNFDGRLAFDASYVYFGIASGGIGRVPK